VEEGVEDPLAVEAAAELLEEEVEAEAEAEEDPVVEAEAEALLLPLVDTAAEEEPVLAAAVAVPVAPEITKRGEKLYSLVSWSSMILTV